MDVIDAVNRRMSVRAFRPDPVDAALVRELLEAAARAPSGPLIRRRTAALLPGRAAHP